MNSLAADREDLGAKIPLLTNLSQLQRNVSWDQGRVCHYALEGTVLASDSNSGTIFLHDASGEAALEMTLEGPTPQPGHRIQLLGTNFVALTDYGLSLGKSPLVDNDGLHPGVERAGTLYLDAGRHPIKVAWFNYQADGILGVTYQGPDGRRKSVPDYALFRRDTQAVKAGQTLVNGLNFRCFEGRWQKLPNFPDQPM